ncbi:hypothetical protein ACU686_21205 [Yinghuangia aomiensis]
MSAILAWAAGDDRPADGQPVQASCTRVEHHPRSQVDPDGGHIVDWWGQYPCTCRVHVAVRALNRRREDETAEHELMDAYDSQGRTSLPGRPGEPLLPAKDRISARSSWSRGRGGRGAAEIRPGRASPVAHGASSVLRRGSIEAISAWCDSRVVS